MEVQILSPRPIFQQSMAASRAHSLIMVKNRILIDVDGVIANFIDYYIKIASDILRKDLFIINKYSWDTGDALGLADHEKKEVDKGLYSYGALGIVPYEGAVEAIIDLANLHDIYFVTTPLDESETWASDRIRWLIKYFGPKLGGKYILTHDKFTVCGDILIDDKTDNVVKWKEAWPKSLPILWAHDYNSMVTDIIRVNNWGRIKDLADHFKRKAAA